MVGWKSQGCRKLIRGSTVIITTSLFTPSTALPYLGILYDRMIFDDVFFMIKLYVEINVILLACISW